jgi:Flp pilus assembly protein TadB
MDWRRTSSIVGLFIVAVLAGGAALRILLVVSDLRTAAALVFVAGLLLIAVLTGAKRRRWLENPYW